MSAILVSFTLILQNEQRVTGSRDLKSKDIIGNLESTLRDANKYYPKMSATNKFTIEQKIQKAISYLPDFATGTPDSNKKMLEQLDSIDKLLNAEADLIKKQRITRFTTSI